MIKIIADSSCDLKEFPDLPFETVPLTLSTDEKSFVDDPDLNVSEVLDYLYSHNGRSYTACPSTQSWLDAFEGADASFELLVHKALKNFKSFFEVENFKTIGEGPSLENEYSASAIIKVIVEGEEEVTAANGDGPVDALNKALRKAIGKFYPILNEVSLSDYKVRILDGKESATAAITRVIIESTDGKSTWSTVGVSKDIIEASFKALIDSVEYKLFKESK